MVGQLPSLFFFFQRWTNTVYRTIHIFKFQFECPPLDENGIAVKIKACGLSMHDNKVRQSLNETTIRSY